MLFGQQAYITALNCVYGEREKDRRYENKLPRKTYVLVYIKEGLLKFSSPESEFSAGEGEFVLIGQNQICSTAFIGERNLIFNFFFTLSQSDPDTKIVHFSKSSETGAIMEKIISRYENSFDKFYVMSYLYRLFHCFNKSIVSDKRFEKIMPALDFINANFTENHSISHYARLCAMSETAFRRLFRELTGQSPTEYRTALRMEKADELILDGQSVSSAILEAGFNSPSFYYRQKRQNKQ